MFSLKNVQSMPCSGIATGRTFANRSSSLRSATFALSILPHLSPLRGVVVGPFSSTLHAFISFSTSSGTALPAADLFSIVSPSIFLHSSFPAAISSARSLERRSCVGSIMSGPMPSPPISPITILSRDWKSSNSLSLFIFSTRASCFSTISSILFL